MAKANKVLKTVTKTVKEEVLDGAVLHLNKSEAETLLLVLGRVGGMREDTRRRYTEAISNALRSAGVKSPVVSSDYDFLTKPAKPEVSGSIYFNLPTPVKSDPYHLSINDVRIRY